MKISGVKIFLIY